MIPAAAFVAKVSQDGLECYAGAQEETEQRFMPTYSKNCCPASSRWCPMFDRGAICTFFVSDSLPKALESTEGPLRIKTRLVDKRCKLTARFHQLLLFNRSVCQNVEVAVIQHWHSGSSSSCFRVSRSDACDFSTAFASGVIVRTADMALSVPLGRRRAVNAVRPGQTTSVAAFINQSLPLSDIRHQLTRIRQLQACLRALAPSDAGNPTTLMTF